MGQHADDFNDYQSSSLEDLMAYESGSISKQEAVSRGILDSDGSMPTNVTTWGVYDVKSLEAELTNCELRIAEDSLRKLRNSRKTKQVWVSGGKAYSPKEMTINHLENAVKYANRNGICGKVVDEMISEIKFRLPKLPKK